MGRHKEKVSRFAKSKTSCAQPDPYEGTYDALDTSLSDRHSCLPVYGICDVYLPQLNRICGGDWVAAGTVRAL